MIISLLDYESIISFARTSRDLKSLTPRYAVFAALLDHEYMHYRGWDDPRFLMTPCYGCFQVKHLPEFDYHDGLVRRYDLGARDASARRCLGCRKSRLERTGVWVSPP